MILFVPLVIIFVHFQFIILVPNDINIKTSSIIASNDHDHRHQDHTIFHPKPHPLDTPTKGLHLPVIRDKGRQYAETSVNGLPGEVDIF